MGTYIDTGQNITIQPCHCGKELFLEVSHTHVYVCNEMLVDIDKIERSYIACCLAWQDTIVSKRFNVLFQAELGLLDNGGQIRVFTPRRGRYPWPFGKSESCLMWERRILK